MEKLFALYYLFWGLGR